MLWGIDVSHYQGDFDFTQAHAESISSLSSKPTKARASSTRGSPRTWPTPGAGLLVAAYHYQRSEDSAQSQVDNISGVVPTGVPVILDVRAAAPNE